MLESLSKQSHDRATESDMSRIDPIGQFNRKLITAIRGRQRERLPSGIMRLGFGVVFGKLDGVDAKQLARPFRPRLGRGAGDKQFTLAPPRRLLDETPCHGDLDSVSDEAATKPAAYHHMPRSMILGEIFR